MYNRRFRSCWCNNNNNSNNNPNVANIIEDSCDCANSSNNCFVDEDDICDCGFDESNVFPSNPMLGQSYVPIQTMDKTFIPEAGLRMGTIFPELVSPYCPCQSIKEIEFLRANNAIGEGCNK